MESSAGLDERRAASQMACSVCMSGTAGDTWTEGPADAAAAGAIPTIDGVGGAPATYDAMGAVEAAFDADDGREAIGCAAALMGITVSMPMLRPICKLETRGASVVDGKLRLARAVSTRVIGSNAEADGWRWAALLVGGGALQ